MTNHISAQALEIIKKMQQSELTESVIYEKIAAFAKGEENKKTLRRLAQEEHAHYLIWKKHTGLDMKPEMGFTEINETRKRMAERSFEVQHLSKEEIKRLLAIYFGASMDGDKMPDVDGEQYTEEKSHGTL